MVTFFHKCDKFITDKTSLTAVASERFIFEISYIVKEKDGEVADPPLRFHAAT